MQHEREAELFARAFIAGETTEEYHRTALDLHRLSFTTEWRNLTDGFAIFRWFPFPGRTPTIPALRLTWFPPNAGAVEPMRELLDHRGIRFIGEIEQGTKLVAVEHPDLRWFCRTATAIALHLLVENPHFLENTLRQFDRLSPGYDRESANECLLRNSSTFAALSEGDRNRFLKLADSLSFRHLFVGTMLKEQ